MMDIERQGVVSETLETRVMENPDLWGRIALPIGDAPMRIVGAGEDESDLYWIAESMAGPHTRCWVSMVGRMDALFGALPTEAYAAYEIIFAQNGSVAPERFLLVGKPQT